MATRRYAGDAPAVAQQTLLPAPPASYSGKVTIGINRKTLEFDVWDATTIVDAWNASEVPDFQRCIASLHEDGVLMTAATDGVPFEITLSFGGGNAFDEVVIISFLNVGTVTGSYDITLLGETITVAWGTSASDIQAALEATASIAPGDVTVTDLGNNQFQLTIAGQYAGQNVTDLTIDDSALRGGTADVEVTKVRDYRAGQNEIQRIVLGGGPTGGTILYDLDGTSIGPVNYNDAVADYQTAFDAALGAGEATVTGPADTGEVGPLQTEDFVADSDADTGFAYSTNGGSVQMTSSYLTLGILEEVVGGDSVYQHKLTGIVQLSANNAVAANLQIERALLQLAVLHSDANARVDLKIRAVNQANPAPIADFDYADFSSRPLTTASVLWTATQSPAGSIISPPSLDAIVQELLDTHGDISNIMLYLETQPGSIGQISIYDPTSTGYVSYKKPTLLVDYRDTPAGPAVFDVEFIGSRAQKSLPLMTANIDSLQPKRQNTIWVIDTVLDTGAAVNSPGVLQLYDGATQLQSAGTSEAGVTFEEGLATILDEQFGPDNYTYRTNVDGEAGRVEIELIEELSGAVDISDDLLLYWTPIATAQEPEGNPVARMELVNEGGAGVGERQRFVVDPLAVAGTLALTDGVTTSAEMPYNLTASQLQTELEAFVGAGKVVCSGTASPEGILCEFDISVGDFTELSIINNLRRVDALLDDLGYEDITGQGSVNQTTIDLNVQIGIPNAIYFTRGNQTVTVQTDVSPFPSFLPALQTLYPDALSITEEEMANNDPAFEMRRLVLRTPDDPDLSVTATAGTGSSASVSTEVVANTDTAIKSTVVVDLVGVILGGTWDLTVFTSLVGQTLNIPAFSTTQYIQDALVEAIPQATEILVTGSTNSINISVTAPFAVNFEVNGAGLLGELPLAEWQLVNEYEAVANERQRLVIDDGEFAGGGYIELTYEGVTVTAFYPGPDIWGVLEQIPALNGNLVVRPAPDYGAGAWEIEFVGSLAGTNVSMISVDSHLTGFEQQGYLTAYWSRSQEGKNGATVTSTELQDGSPPVGAQSLVRITNNPHYGTFTLTDGVITTSAFQYNATAATIQAGMVAGGFVVTCIGDLAEGLLCSFPASEGDVNLSGNNIDLTNARISVLTLVQGGILSSRTLQRSQGPNHFDDPLNWLPQGPVDSGDELIFESGNVSCLYGLRQRSAFTVDTGTDEIIVSGRPGFLVGQIVSISSNGTLPAGLVAADDYVITAYDIDTGRIALKRSGSAAVITDLGNGIHTIRLAVTSLKTHGRFTGAIGIPRWNPDGFVEYLPTELEIGFMESGERKLTLAQGRGSASGRTFVDLGNDAVDIEVFQTGGSQNGIPAFVVLGSNDQNTLVSYEGSIGPGYYEQTEFRYQSMVLHGGEVLGTNIVSAANAVFDNFGASTEFQNHQFTGKQRSQS